MKLQNPAIARFRPYALLCVLLVLVSALIGEPFSTMGVSDDWSYGLTTSILAHTGHIVYNGWAAAMLGWQLYFGALFVKLFGDSYTSMRFSTLVVSLLIVFLLQRIMVRSGITEWNATVGTLAFALTPIYMQISVTFMSDIHGLFAIVLCLYACIRALQAATSRNATLWIVFAIVLNVILGSARQTGWLGALVLVPMTLLLLRKDRGTFFIGGLFMLAGWIGIYETMHWYARQPYSLTEPLSFHVGGLHGAMYLAWQMLKTFLETLFLILPLTLAFFPWARRGGKALIGILIATGVGYTAMAIVMTRRANPKAILEPMLGDWFTNEGFYSAGFHGTKPIVLGTIIRIVLTVVATLATLCFLAFVLHLRKTENRRVTGREPDSTLALTWKQLWYLLVPFVIVYCGLLLPRASSVLRDRYLLPLCLVAAIAMLRLHQTYLRPRLPRWTIAVVAVVAIFSICCIHDLFALSRARVTMTAELEAAGIPRTAVDGGFEFNGETQIAHGGFINDPRINTPPHSFVPGDSHRGLACTAQDEIDVGVLRVVPQYGLAYTPDACAGSLPIAPVTYSRWLLLSPGKLYAVKFGQHSATK